MSRRQKAGFLDIDEDCIKDGYTKDERKKRSSIHTLSTFVGFIFIVMLLSEYVAVFYLDSTLPEPLTISDEKNNPEAFITERALATLISLTDLGPRIVGSYENEVLSVEILKRKIKHIQENANREQDIELDHQIVSGSYFLDFQLAGFVNVYKNVQNIVVKLNGVNSTSSLLVNAHYDSIPGSPGASDDGIMCAVMIEIIEKLSKLPERPQHNIIFLFNGAEEAGLQASHGFITQHRWAKEAKVIINLEAGGSAGKEILFQTGPRVAWLLKYYQKVPHPYGQVAGEELFQNNFIPSDTDFRIFRDFGNLVGYDFAYARNGYRYHTRYDAIQYIPLGSYQHAGDNVLSLIKNLANAPEMDNPDLENSGNAVYYDIFGFFMVSYSYFTSILINMGVAIASVVMATTAFKDFGQGFSWRTIKLVFGTYNGVLFGWMASLGFMYFVTTFLDSVNRTMSWFTNPWIIFGLYCAPCIAITYGTLCLTKQQENISVSIQAQLEIHMIRLLWTCLLIAGVYLEIRSVYAVMLWVLFNTMFFVFLKVTRWQYSIRKWQLLYMITSVVPTFMIMYWGIVVSSLFIPLTGRMGPSTNPEMLMGTLSVALTIFCTSFYAPLIKLIRKPFSVIALFFFVFALTLIAVFTPMGFPYSGNVEYPTPQRCMVYHTSRTFRNETNDVTGRDSGIAVFSTDRNSPRSVASYVPEFENATSVHDDCKKYVLCGLALASSRKISSIESTLWIPFEEPIRVEPTSLELTAKTKLSDSITRFNFTALDHSSLYIKPKNGCAILETTYATAASEGVIFIGYISGTEQAPLEFFVDVGAPADWEGPLLDVVVSGRNVHGKVDQMSKSFVRFYKSFPSWTDVDVAVATYDSFMF